MISTAHQPGLFAEDVELFPGEIEVIRKKEALTISQWGEKHYVVTDGEWTGPLSLAHTPYLKKPMDTLGLPHVRKVMIVGSNQSGKTLILYVVWAYSQHYLHAPALLVMADESTADKVVTERLVKIIAQSPALQQITTGRAADISKKHLRLLGSTTFTGWPRSEATLQTFPRQIVLLDEMRLYDWPDASMDPVEHAETRIMTYQHKGMVIGASTTDNEHDFAWVNLLKCQRVEVFAGRCPACGEYQIFSHKQLRWDDSLDAEPDRIESEKLAWYECEKCSAAWGETDYRRAARAGRYAPQKWDAENRRWLPDENPPSRPISVGFQFSGFYSPFVSLHKIAAQAAKAKADVNADIAAHQKFYAIPYRHEKAVRVEDEILRLCDDRPPGLVPDGIAALAAMVDVHDDINGHRYIVRAFAPGPDRESWLVAAGVVNSFAALTQVLTQRRFKDARGQEHVISFGLIDSGYRSREVYDWCLANPPFFPSKGQENMTQPFRLGKINTHLGLPLVHVNTTYYKNDLLQGKLLVSPGDPGAFHLHTNIDEHGREGLLVNYARQLCSEHKDDRGRWQQLSGKPNHFLDCEVGCLAAADYIGTRHLPTEPEAKPAPRPETKTRSNPAARRRPGWFKTRRL